MRSNTIRPLLIIFLIAYACQEDDVYLPEIQDVVINQESLYWREIQNSWIFTQMSRNYFWADQLRDSLDYDYSMEPSLFFESMLVPEDRFSFCEYYEGYRPPVKGVGLNETVSLDSVYISGDSKVGYFIYDGFETEADITDIILKLGRKGIDELVIDLRNNPGGLVNTCKYLASLIVPAKYLGQVFCRYRFNSFLSKKLMKETGTPFETVYLDDDYLTIGRNLSLSRVFFLVNHRSASCSELIINSLRPYMQTVVIGETTTGKDVGMRACSHYNYKYRLYPITFRSYNAIGDSVPVTGIIPDIYLEDNPGKPKGDIEEAMLSKALELISQRNE